MEKRWNNRRRSGIGDRVYEIIIESNDRQKTKKLDHIQENKPNGRSALINQIKLSPSQAQELFAFLQSHSNQIQEIADEDAKAVKRTLGQVYSLILRSGEKGEKES